MALLALAAGGAGAAEWTVEPRIAQELGYDDNIALDTERDDSGGFVSSTRAGVRLGGRSPVLDLRLDAALTYNDYRQADQGSSDAEEARAEAIRHGQRTDAGLILGFRRDSEIIDFLDDTGERQRTNNPRYTYWATPYVTHKATPRDRLDAALSWRRRDGGDDGDRVLGTDSGVDFTTWSGNAGWRRSATRRTTLGLDLYGSYYDSSRQESVIGSPRLFVGYRYAERVDLSLAAGPGVARTETDEPGGRRSDTQLTYTLDGIATLRLGPVTTLVANASHYLEPSSDDGEVRRTGRLNVALSHRLAPRLRLDAAGLGQQQSGVSGAGGDDRTFVQASAGLAYELTQRLDATLRYRVRYEHFSGGDGQGGDDATSNAVLVGLSYDFPALRRSW
jgi:opacity protein-like surface antigen